MVSGRSGDFLAWFSSRSVFEAFFKIIVASFSDHPEMRGTYAQSQKEAQNNQPKWFSVLKRMSSDAESLKF